MMFRTLSFSALAALVQGAVIESKPQQLKMQKDAGKILTEAGVAAAAAGVLAAAANKMGTAGSSKSSDDDETTSTPGPECDFDEKLAEFLKAEGLTGTTPDKLAQEYCDKCGNTASTCDANAEQCFTNIYTTPSKDLPDVNPDKLSCPAWAEAEGCDLDNYATCFGVLTHKYAAKVPSCDTTCDQCTNDELCVSP